jgi:segregation and condensation protein A
LIILDNNRVYKFVFNILSMENEVEKKEVKEHPSHTQVYDIIVGRDPSWQSIIYDLVASEQLDPWNIEIATLCKGYFEKINRLEENGFHISSKLLLAAALLLRIKSEILLNKYVREIDDILFPKNDDIQKIIERIEIDESEIPVLSPKTPMPRFKKVTLQELIDALDVAIKTESRRIDKEIQKKQAERLSHVDIPKFRRINIKDRIRHFYAKVLSAFKTKKGEIKLPYSHFTGNSKEEKLACFLPMLYLSNHGRVWLEQEGHFSEIWLYLYEIFKKQFPDFDKNLAEENQEEGREFIEDIKEAMYEDMGIDEDRQKRVEEINRDFENPLDNLIEDSPAGKLREVQEVSSVDLGKGIN